MTESEEIKVGDKVIVMDDLETVIIDIIGEKYYFKDKDGQVWHEVKDSIKKYGQ